jgi:cell division protease FtsH
LGYTIQRPIEDRFLMTRGELENKMAVLLGGRAAETLIFQEVSTGAADDLMRATDIARSMVTRYGMDATLGLATWEAEPSTFLQIPGFGNGRRHSEETAREIDVAVRAILDRAYTRASDILTRNRRALERGAQELLGRETLSGDELPALDAPLESTR